MHIVLILRNSSTGQNFFLELADWLELKHSRRPKKGPEVAVKYKHLFPE